MERARKYLEIELFRPDTDRSPMARSLRAALRTLVLAVRGFFRDEGFFHASALAFDSVISIVPLLVIAFATLRGLGAYDVFVNSTLRPWIEHTFGPAVRDRSTLREAFVRLFELGEGVNLAALGIIGIVLLLYLVVVLLATTETTLNRIWGVHRPRRLVRKAADYAAILFVIPFAMSFAATVGQAAGRASWLAPITGLLDVVATIIAGALVASFVYLVMPHTRVRVKSAIWGGVVAGALWTLVLWAYTTFQIGVSRYNALYSSFAAVPLFLVFIFVCWAVVLFGAEIAAAHQNPAGFRWRIRHGEASAATRRHLSVRFAVEITHAFVAGEHPPTLQHLAALGRVPENLARDLLEELTRAGIVVHAYEQGRRAYALGRDPSGIRVSDVLAAVDHREEPREIASGGKDARGQRVEGVLAELDRASRESQADVDLRSLAAA